MHVQIPVRPWAGDRAVPLEEAAIMVSPDLHRATDSGSEFDPKGYAAYTVVLGGVAVGCTSWRIEVGEDGPFMVMILEGVIRRDWDAFVEEHTLDGLLQGSGRLGWDPEEETTRVMWRYPASRLIVAPTSIELSVMADDPVPA